jgi:hypothetical protein
MKAYGAGIAALAIAIVIGSGASAAPIRTLPGLLSVTIYEETFATTPNTYAPNSSQLTTRLADPLSAVNNDFSFFADEYYDVFYSDANGAFNINGAYVTIEGVWRNHGIGLGGMNINEVQLNFVGPVNDFADFVSSFVFGTCAFGGCIAGSEALAVDQNLGTFPRFGHTSNVDLNDRFRLTVGFNDISTSEVPLPGAVLLFASGLAGLGLLRWRRTSRRPLA